MAYRKLRELIPLGQIAPGQAVMIQGLVEKLEAGMTPVREAIRRLISASAFNLQDNRRIIVPELSDQNMSELYFFRKTLESQLLALATARANKEDMVRLALTDAYLYCAINKEDINLCLSKNYYFIKNSIVLRTP